MDDKDIDIMLRLLENPDISNKEISDLTNISQATVSRRVKQLYDNKVLLGKQLNLNRLVLKMDVYHIFFKISKEWRQNLCYLQHIFKQHAYTAYQNKVFGAFNGLFVQLSLPHHTVEKLQELIDKLIQVGLVSDYSIFQQSGDQFRSNLDSSKYDKETRMFILDLDTFRDKNFENRDNIQFSKSSVNPKLLSKEMVALISELFTDANRSLEEIGTRLGSSKQEISRKKKIGQLDDWGYNTLYDRRQFGVFNQCYYILNFDTKEAKNLYYLLNEHYPFQASMIPCHENLLLWINLPAINVMEFTELLQQRFTVVQFFLLSRNPKTYPPWKDNIKKNDWRAETEYITKIFDENWKDLLTIDEFVSKLEKSDIKQLEIQFETNSNN